MFGRPEWFQKKGFARGFAPVGWQGWTYVGLWLAAIMAPFWLFQTLSQTLESYIWLMASIGGAVWDVRHLRRSELARTNLDDVFVIDEDTDISRLTTRNFDMNLRD